MTIATATKSRKALNNPPRPAITKEYPQASWTITDGVRLPFIPSHNVLPKGTLVEVTTRTGTKSFVKLLALHGRTPYGYLYTYEPVKTLIFDEAPPVVAGGKLRYNYTPYEVLSVNFVPTAYDEDDRLIDEHYVLEVIEIDMDGYDPYAED